VSHWLTYITLKITLCCTKNCWEFPVLKSWWHITVILATQQGEIGKI
jgi:hypothetical protein